MTSQFGLVFLGNVIAGGAPAALYDFSAMLPSAFTAAAGTTYWLSIISHSPTFAPTGWAWTNGLNGDGISIQEFVETGSTTQLDDRTFALVAAPEPGSLLLLGSGLAALVGRYRRLKLDGRRLE